MSEYQIRLSKDISGQQFDPSGMFEAVSATLTLTAALPSVRAVLDEIEKDDEYSGHKILSIILIDSRNQELLGDEYLNGGNE